MAATPDPFKLIQDGEFNALGKLVALKPQIASSRNAQGLSLLMWALYNRKKEAVEALMKAGAPTDLFEAAAVGRLEQVDDETREDRARANAWSHDGFPLLGLAAFFGQLEVAALLVARGADVEAVARNPMKVQPLHSAAACGRTDIVALLLANGANANARQASGFTPLHAAAQLGNAGMARVLLAFGADPSLPTDDGKLPEDLARAQGHKALAALLAG